MLSVEVERQVAAENGVQYEAGAQFENGAQFGNEAEDETGAQFETEAEICDNFQDFEDHPGLRDSQVVTFVDRCCRCPVYNTDILIIGN